MKLIDKIQKAHSGKLSDYSKIYTPTANAIERISDDYAVEFLNWYISISSIMDKKYIGKTSKELLEIFKIEKGL
jgi:hypothetical protein